MIGSLVNWLINSLIDRSFLFMLLVSLYFCLESCG